MRDLRAVEAGREAQAAGSSFEDWISAQHDAAKYLGILAHVVHNEPRVKFIGGRPIFEKATVADYTGVLCGGGARTLAVEAKSTKADRFALSDVTPKQQEHLDVVAKEGGLALLVLEFRAQRDPRVALMKHRFAIPWLEVPWRVKRTVKAVYLDEIISSPDWRVHPNCYLLRWHAGGPRSTLVRASYPAE